MSYYMRLRIFHFIKSQGSFIYSHGCGHRSILQSREMISLIAHKRSACLTSISSTFDSTLYIYYTNKNGGAGHISIYVEIL